MRCDFNKPARCPCWCCARLTLDFPGLRLNDTRKTADFQADVDMLSNLRIVGEVMASLFRLHKSAFVTITGHFMEKVLRNKTADPLSVGIPKMDCEMLFNIVFG